MSRGAISRGANSRGANSWGANSIISNYRPVSNLCITSKVLEKVVLAQRSDYFEKKKLMPSGQHGFRQGFSTSSAVISMHSRWSQERRKGKFVGVCCFDLSSAFDVVDHYILLKNAETVWFVKT